MVTRGLLILLLVMSVRPGAQAPHRDPRPEDWTAALRATLEIRFGHYADDGGVEARHAMLDVLDDLAEDVLVRDPDIDPESLDRRLASLPHTSATVLELSEGERAVIWDGLENAIWGGGARVSLFARRGGSWHQVGHVDSQDTTSHVDATVLDDGIVLVVEAFEGNGDPPWRPFAVAIDGERLITATTGEVARVEVDGDEIRISRRIARLTPYPDDPLRFSRWTVARVGHRLTATETLLTPWIDVLALFCSGAHAEVASPDVLHAVAHCNGRVADARWNGRDEVVVELPLVLRCLSEDTWWADSRDSGTLTLTRSDDVWMVTGSTGCDD